MVNRVAAAALGLLLSPAREALALIGSPASTLIGQLEDVDFQGLGEKYLRSYVAKVNAVTPAEVQKIAQDYLKPQEMTIVVVGDKAKITDQLTPFQPAK